MNIETFRQLADIHGGDLSRWPGQHQSAAAALLRQDPEAARIIDDALAVDRWLDAAAVRVSDEQVERVAGAIAARLDRAEGKSRGLRQNTAPGRVSGTGPALSAAFLGLMGLLGVVSGALAPDGWTVAAPSPLASPGASTATATTTISLADVTGYYSSRYFVEGSR